MKTSIFTTAGLILVLATPVAADPAVGLGINFSWGGGSQGDTGIGLRIFSDDERDQFVGSLGVDYLFTSQRVRPNIGIAYLATKSYVGMDVGFGFGGEGLDVGVGLGYADTRKKAAAPLPVLEGEGGIGPGTIESPPPQ